MLGTARTHRREWVEGYRGELGFVTAVLHDIGTPPDEVSGSGHSSTSARPWTIAAHMTNTSRAMITMPQIG